jgi:hypothetical protein
MKAETARSPHGRQVRGELHDLVHLRVMSTAPHSAAPHPTPPRSAATFGPSRRNGFWGDGGDRTQPHLHPRQQQVVIGTAAAAAAAGLRRG